MKYKCIKDFEVDGYDDDGLPTEKPVLVKSGSVWRGCGLGYVIDGEIHLDDKNGNWLEISKETLEEYFEPIEEANHAE